MPRARQACSICNVVDKDVVHSKTFKEYYHAGCVVDLQIYWENVGDSIGVTRKEK